MRPARPQARPLPRRHLPCRVLFVAFNRPTGGPTIYEYFHTGRALCPWLQVLSHVSTCVRDIHAANYVHRNVKPAHIIHLRQENRWKLTDFDRAAVLGAAVPLDFTLAYASPELVAASDSGQDMVAAHPTVDCWAMGVVAFELLTGQQLLDSTDDREAVCSLCQDKHMFHRRRTRV